MPSPGIDESCPTFDATGQGDTTGSRNYSILLRSAVPFRATHQAFERGNELPGTDYCLLLLCRAFQFPQHLRGALGMPFHQINLFNEQLLQRTLRILANAAPSTCIARVIRRPWRSALFMRNPTCCSKPLWLG